MTGPEHYREAERLLEYGPHDEEEKRVDDITAGRPAGTWYELCLFLGGSPDSFTGHLLDLIVKADPGNRARLRAEFPRQVAAWEAWCQLAPCTWGELDAEIPEHAKRVTVTFDLSDADARHVLTQALEDYSARARDSAARDGGSFTRRADLADQMKRQAEEAAG